MTEVKPSPITAWRPKPAEVEAVRWDGSPEVLAVLEEWGAEPTVMGDALRVWGPRDGYKGALRGDWLVRQADARLPGVARYTSEEFAERFEAPASPDGTFPGDGELIARALLLQQAQDAIAFEQERAEAAEAELADALVKAAQVLQIAENFLAEYGDSATDMFKVGQDLASAVVKILDTGVESEPCNQHEEAEGDA